MTGDYAKAISALEEAVALNPTAIAYFNLAVAYRETGEFAQAVRVLELYLQDPGDAPEANVIRARSELARLKDKLK
jgi:tetratricopeptide (TPR) repeat protein